VVVDVFLDILQEGNQRPTETKPLEINPFFERTDSSLFSGLNSGDFDGTFRYIRPGSNP
jgi:hypothetical protein